MTSNKFQSLRFTKKKLYQTTLIILKLKNRKLKSLKSKWLKSSKRKLFLMFTKKLMKTNKLSLKNKMLSIKLKKQRKDSKLGKTQIRR